MTLIALDQNLHNQPDDGEVLVRVENVSKKFCRSLKKSLWYGISDIASEVMGCKYEHELRPDEFWAIKDVSFELRRGECLGLIGRNGAGKTTLLRMLNGLIKPDKGEIEMQGRIAALIALGAGFNPILTGRENIYVNGSVLGLSKKEIDEKVDDIIDFSEIEEFIDSPVQSYSSGMQVRLGFAVATALNPDVLILDEVLAVGDANFQAKCYQRIGKIIENCAVILVSHFPHHIKKLCDQAILLEKGTKVAEGKPDDILSQYDRNSKGIEEQELIILSDKVKAAAIREVTPFIKHGGTFSFVLDLSVMETESCDQAYLNIVDKSGIVHAQVILEQLLEEFGPGKFSCFVSIGPLHLSKGIYKGNLMLCSNGGKTTFAHLRNCFTFESDGPISLGPYYYPPSSIVITKR